MAKKTMWWIGLLVASVLPVACSDTNEPVAPSVMAAPRTAVSQIVPSPLASVTFGESTLSLWPYTWDGVDADLKVDPIHLVFPGAPDPRQIRAALLLLDGNRSAFGVAETCVWQDALGGSNQTAYAQGGWAGSAIQLTCGAYSQRFHLRLFSAGDWTLGAAHFEVNIPGTQEHEVLSWEAAKSLVMLDLYRAGIALPPPYVSQTAPITDYPTYREVRSEVYAMLDAATKAALGLTTSAIPNSGTAAIEQLSDLPEGERLVVNRELTIDMDQTVPTFCSEEIPYVHVEGPLTFQQHVVMTASGNYVSQVKALGTLDVTTLTGETYKAIIHDMQHGLVTDNTTLVTFFQLQTVVPMGTYAARLRLDFRVGPAGSASYTAEMRCN